MNIDRARIAAVRTLEAAGYTYEGGELWKPPLGEPDTRDDLARLIDAINTLQHTLLNMGLCKGAAFVFLDSPDDLRQLDHTLTRSRDWPTQPDHKKARCGQLIVAGVRFTYDVPF